MANARTIYLCATRFWGMSPGTATLRRGVRHVARKQDLLPSEMDKAERSLVKAGLIERGGKNMGASLKLTPKGVTVSGRACRKVELPPWDATKSFRGSRRR